MKKRYLPSNLFLFMAAVLTLCGLGFSNDQQAKLRAQAEKLISEGALLEPIAACGEAINYTADIGGGYMCGITNGRLITFSKDNIHEVIDSHWLPSRIGRIFAFYQRYVYLFNNTESNNNIVVFDVTDPANISRVKEIDIRLGAYADFDLVDDKLYVVDCRDNSLVVFSLADPASPEEISRTLLSETNHSNPKSSVKVTDERIYILAAMKLFVLDKESKDILGNIEIKSNMRLGGLAVQEPYAHVFVETQIVTFDVSNPEAIVKKNFTKTDPCYRVVMRDGRLVGYQNDIVHVYDLADPLNPALAKSYSTKAFLVGHNDNYVVDKSGSVSALRTLPDPSNCETTGSFRAMNMIIRNNIAFVGSVGVFDISQPWAPRNIGKIPIVTTGGEMLLEGNYLYTSGIIIDVSDPGNVRGVARLSMDKSTGITLHESKLFIAAGKMLQIWDVASVAEPKILKSIDMGEELHKVLAHKGIIYLGFQSGMVRSCKIGDDLSLVTLDEIELCSGTDCELRDMCEDDDFLYVALYRGGIISIDIARPEELEVYAKFNTRTFTNRIKVVEAFAYIANTQNGTVIVDMAQPGFEKQLASYPSTDLTRDIAVSGNYVFSCEDENGIAVFASSLDALKENSPVGRSDDEADGRKIVATPPDDDIKIPADYKATAAKRVQDLIDDGAVLEPVAALGDSCFNIAEISDELICGITSERLKIFRKSNIEDVIGSYWMPSRNWRMIQYYNGHVYLAQHNGPIRIFDVRNPADIRLVGQIQKDSHRYPKIDIYEDMLLLVNMPSREVVTYSLSDPASPKKLSSCIFGEEQDGWVSYTFGVNDGMVYILGKEELTVVDASNPYSLQLKGVYALNRGSGSNLAVKDNYIYIRHKNDSMIDTYLMSGQTGLEHKATVKTIYYEWEHALIRDTHFIGIGSSGIFVYDITNPLKPELVRYHYGEIPNNLLFGKSVDFSVNRYGKAERFEGFPNIVEGAGWFDYTSNQILVNGGFAYLLGTDQLRVVDISKPWDPKPVGRMVSYLPSYGDAVFKENYIYSKTVIDVSNPAKPTPALLPGTNCPIMINEFLLGLDNEALRIWNLENPANPNCVKDIQLEEKPHAMFTRDGVIYVATGNTIIESYMLNKDLTLTKLGHIEFEPCEKGQITDWSWQGDIVYLARNGQGIICLNTADPENLKVIGEGISEPNWSVRLSATDSFLYMATTMGLELLDTAQKGNPQQVTFYQSSHPYNTVTAWGNYVFFGNPRTGITVFASNPRR